MPKNKRHSTRKEGMPAHKRGPRQRRLSVRSELLKEPDVEKIARTVVALAVAQAEKEAAAQVAGQQESANG